MWLNDGSVRAELQQSRIKRLSSPSMSTNSAYHTGLHEPEVAIHAKNVYPSNLWDPDRDRLDPIDWRTIPVDKHFRKLRVGDDHRSSFADVTSSAITCFHCTKVVGRPHIEKTIEKHISMVRIFEELYETKNKCFLSYIV